MTRRLAIYEPPVKDLPFLVVIFENGGMSVVQVASRTEARRLVSEKARQQAESRSADEH